MRQSPVGAVRIGAHKPHEGQVDALDALLVSRYGCSSRVRQSGIVQLKPQERAGVTFRPNYRTELRIQPADHAVPVPSG